MKTFSILLIAVLLFNRSESQTLSSSVTASSGNYFSAGGYSLSWTLGQAAQQTFSTAGNKLTQGFQQPELDLLTIITDDTVCAGNIAIPFYATGYVGSSNQFTAQLSDASGSFASPLNIGSTTGNHSDTIHASIPVNVTPGQGYRIRVVSSLPVRNSTAAIIITLQICGADLAMYAFIEGFYDESVGEMRSPLNASGLNNDILACDSVTIELRNTIFPYSLFHSLNVLLKKDGTMQCAVPAAAIGNSYYIVIKSRNTIETWSKLPVSFGNSTVMDMRY